MTVPASVEMVVLGPRDEFLRILERELEAGFTFAAMRST